MRADVLPEFGRRADFLRTGLRLAHRPERHQAKGGPCPRGQTRAAQKRAAVEDARGKPGGEALQTRPACGSIFSLHQHVRGPISIG
jgi:hypothetical protein